MTDDERYGADPEPTKQPPLPRRRLRTSEILGDADMPPRQRAELDARLAAERARAGASIPGLLGEAKRPGLEVLCTDPVWGKRHGMAPGLRLPPTDRHPAGEVVCRRCEVRKHHVKWREHAVTQRPGAPAGEMLVVGYPWLVRAANRERAPVLREGAPRP